MSHVASTARGNLHLEFHSLKISTTDDAESGVRSTTFTKVSRHSSQLLQGSCFEICLPVKIIGGRKKFRTLLDTMSLLTSITRIAISGTLPSRMSQSRWYNPQVLSDLKASKLQHRAKELQLADYRPKTFKPALGHFRLSRFGWEHRKAGAEGELRRKRSHKAAVLASRIGYVNPRDYEKMHLYFPHMKLRYRFAPVDSNLSLSSVRTLLPRLIG